MNTKTQATSTNPRRARNIIILLAASMALVMTGVNIIWPIFARRFSELGSGVEALGLLAMAGAFTNIIASPFMGSLADRIGRRPLVLASLAAFVLSNSGYLLASSVQAFILVRVLEGAFTAGLNPAAMSIVADIAPPDKRARWIGIVGGGASVGWILGPALGGVLYDNWGFAVPFAASALMALVALVAAIIMVPETRARRAPRQQQHTPAPKTPLRATLPRPLRTLGVLLFISFSAIFAWAFVEPRLMFYIFEDLNWTMTQFGLASAAYGAALVVGQMTLGQLSDKRGRKPVLIVGVLLHSAQYAGMALTASFRLVALAYAVAGLGEALMTPALTALYLDITPQQHRARAMGIKAAAGSFGSLSGPALAVLVNRFITPQSTFAASVVLLACGALLTLIVLREPERAPANEPAAQVRAGH